MSDLDIEWRVEELERSQNFEELKAIVAKMAASLMGRIAELEQTVDELRANSG